MEKQSSINTLRFGIAGPVGSGKTALLDALCKTLRHTYQVAVVTNDIYTQEDAQFLVKSEALPRDRVLGVETGGCPHAAIREDASLNLSAINKIDLAPYVGADLAVMERDAKKMRGDKPFVFTNLKTQDGLTAVQEFIVSHVKFS